MRSPGLTYSPQDAEFLGECVDGFDSAGVVQLTERRTHLVWMVIDPVAQPDLSE